MTKNNDRSETKPLDVEHELPAGPDEADETPAAEPQSVTSGAAPAATIDLDKLTAERNTLLDRLARLQSEFDNSRKRMAREQQEFKDFALAEALKSLLPILDSFDRALQAPTQSLEVFRSGVELIRKQFEDALTKLGLNRVPAKGETFDPRVHQAVEVADTTSGNDNTVLEELQRGYKLRDRLLRPALVRVARHRRHDSQPKAA